MRNRLLTLAAGFLLLAGAASAQTSLNSTTISTAVTAATNTVVLASGTNVAAGDILFVDREAMLINSISSATAQVRRGWAGTAARAHAAGATVYTGVPSRFYNTEVVGTCTATAELYTPRVVLPTGNVYQCQNSIWQKIGADVGSITVTCRALLVADMVDQYCFTADRDYVVTKITYIHVTPESAGTLTVIPRKTSGTTAIASGTALATAINAVAAGTAANTLVTATLSTTASDLVLASSNRLALDFTDDTAGELANVEVTFTLTPR